VQPLAYSDPAHDAGAQRHLPPGFAAVTVILGASLLLGYAWSLLADLTGWADPFYRKFRTRGITISMPSTWLMAGIAAGHAISGCLQVAGGLGCIGAPRAWARVTLFVYALLETATVVTAYVSGWIAQQPSRASYSSFESAGQALLRVAYAAPAVGLPLLTLLLIRPRRNWPLRGA
jgi:hypothetical protein